MSKGYMFLLFYISKAWSGKMSVNYKFRVPMLKGRIEVNNRLFCCLSSKWSLNNELRKTLLKCLLHWIQSLSVSIRAHYTLSRLFLKLRWFKPMNFLFWWRNFLFRLLLWLRYFNIQFLRRYHRSSLLVYVCLNRRLMSREIRLLIFRVCPFKWSGGIFYTLFKPLDFISLLPLLSSLWLYLVFDVCLLFRCHFVIITVTNLAVI